MLLSLAAVFLQIAVFLQPLLPKQYQVAPVCETITRALLLPLSHEHQAAHSHHADHSIQTTSVEVAHDHHDANHQCQYCTVYANLVLPPDVGVKEILVRVQVRLVAFQQTFHHVYFALQRLFLLPQGRAPPVFA